MRAWAYLRTSTDDKGQDPLRQVDRMTPWAKTENVEVLGHSIDEGKSALKTSPFERPGFKEAIEKARFHGCQAILVETGDRFTRRGTQHWFVYSYMLQKDHGLKLWVADEPLERQETEMGAVIASIKAMAANEWIVNHSRKVTSGMARKRCTLPRGHPRGPGCTGSHFGNPAKVFTPDELELIWQARQGPARVGWRTLAWRLSDARGAFKVASEERRRALSVSSVTVRRAYAALERVKEYGQLTHPTTQGGEAA